MNEPTYTAIPDTSDSNYWEFCSSDRSTTFVPKDKELHQELKRKAWALIQASQNKKNRKGHY
ncbi:hypothetical protein IC229_18405 [Spirosoma sp. BT702]|uniref:Uncharacterized protein n=1 Tax=Spirosoma profusum TaxID=2771354 RepID=A0A926XYK8_9BACT|nr:hypothetical protein [Spirosoma profusum]MBD2702625.1 hypothetical protein [Spirosoma profusum]